MRAAGLVCLLCLLGCEVTPDPCATYRLACLAVTVQSGPPETYYLWVTVDDYPGNNIKTPKDARPREAPLTYPLRFAVEFEAFDRGHKGEVTINISARNKEDNEHLGSVRTTVKIDNTEKQRVSVRLGAPFDLATPPDLSPAPDLRRDLSEPVDLGGAGD